MLGAVIALWLLNLFDAIATWYAIAIGHYAHEANPFMRFFIDNGWFYFFAIKVALGSMASAGLWFGRPLLLPDRQVRILHFAFICVSIYGAMAIMHIVLFVDFLRG